MEIYGIIIIVICFIIVGLLSEKLMHMNESSVERLTIYLLSDIKAIIGGFLKFIVSLVKKERQYHIFDETLVIGLKNTVAEYTAKGFDVECSVFRDTDPQTPIRYISVRFPVKCQFTEDLLEQISFLEWEQFKRYLCSKNLPWKSFSAYNYDRKYLRVLIYYAEFPDEERYLQAKYEMRVKQNASSSSGVIKDEELEKELADVN